MKGVLFNVVEEVVLESMSADAWDDILDAADVDGGYTSLGTYDDVDLVKIVQATAAAAGLSVPDTLRLAGRTGFKHLVKRAPQLLDGLDDWESVISALDDIIHPEVRKVYPDAEVPGFATVAVDGGLRVTYTSRRALCALADGLIVGAGSWFGADLTVVHECCVHHGDDSCTMLVTALQ